VLLFHPKSTAGERELVGQRHYVACVSNLCLHPEENFREAVLNLGLTILLPEYSLQVGLHLKEVDEMGRDGRRVMMVAKGWEDMLLSHWDFLQSFVTLIQEKERIN